MAVSYSIKLVNRSKKSDFRVYNLRVNGKFKNLVALQDYLKEKFEEVRDCDNMEFGYIMPGHGWRGKMKWISDDEDIDELYSVYTSKKINNILLWCHLPVIPSKKHQTSNGSEPASKRAKCATNNTDKTSEASKILEELRKKHEKKYTPEQLHAWAQLLQMKSHASLDDPPDYPFFKGRKAREQHAISVAEAGDTSKCSSLTMDVESAASKINIRSECIQQLQKVGELLEKGIISQQQHNNLQEKIMKDIL